MAANASRAGFGRRHAWRCGMALAGVLACQPGWAQGSDFARLDVRAQPERIDMTLLPPTSRSLGLAVGMSGFAVPASARGAGLAPVAQQAVDVGLQWRGELHSDWRIDVTAWHRVSPTAPDASVPLQAAQPPTFGARVELQMGTPRQANLATPYRGFLGVQLDNGGRLALRGKHGGPIVYYRNTF